MVKTEIINVLRRLTYVTMTIIQVIPTFYSQRCDRVDAILVLVDYVDG